MPHIVSISSLKGGVGKTSLTLGLASAALYAGQRVLVIDMDPHADSSTGLGLPVASVDIGTMLAHPGQYSLDEGVCASAWNSIAAEQAPAVGEDDAAAGLGSVEAVRGSAASTALEHMEAGEELDRLVALLAGTIDDYDLVLIDCPPTLGRLTSMAWAASDRVISVAEPSLFSVAGTERTLRAIARFEENTDYSVGSASVVINKVRSTPEHSFRIDEMKSMFGELVAEPVLEDLDSFQRIQGAAYPLHFWPETSAQDFAADLTALYRGLID